MDRIRISNTTIRSSLFEYSNSSNNSDQHWYHWTALEGWKECFCRILHYLASQTLIAENNVAILNSQCKLIFHTKTLLVPVGKIIHMYNIHCICMYMWYVMCMHLLFVLFIHFFQNDNFSRTWHLLFSGDIQILAFNILQSTHQKKVVHHA